MLVSACSHIVKLKLTLKNRDKDFYFQVVTQLILTEAFTKSEEETLKVLKFITWFDFHYHLVASLGSWNPTLTKQIE